MSTKPNIVLVHGAWADGSSWSKVIPLLKEAGFNTVVTQQRLTSLSDDVEIVRRAAESLQDPVILVGHSYGGAVITEAAQYCPNVAALVYIAGFAPDKGESLALLSSGSPVVPPGAAAIRPDKYGFLWIDRKLFAENFCGDVDQVEAEIMAAVQKPLSMVCFEDQITNAGWKKLPCWYQISTDDRMIPPQAEQFMAKRINARTISIASSHASLVSHSKEIADLILEAATEITVITASKAKVNA
jgi:pimeloyl-ACP methyl ester carboxylesterase